MLISSFIVDTLWSYLENLEINNKFVKKRFRLFIHQRCVSLKRVEKKNYYDILTRVLESLAGCRTMFLFAAFCKIGALERNAY